MTGSPRPIWLPDKIYLALQDSRTHGLRTQNNNLSKTQPCALPTWTIDQTSEGCSKGPKSGPGCPTGSLVEGVIGSNKNKLCVHVFRGGARFRLG